MTTPRRWTSRKTLPASDERLENSIFFIDEIHRLKPALEECCTSRWRISRSIGSSAKAPRPGRCGSRSPFTLVGATTKAGSVSSPLASRFGITAHIEFYNEEELANIIDRSSKIIDVRISEARFSPRPMQPGNPNRQPAPSPAAGLRLGSR